MKIILTPLSRTAIATGLLLMLTGTATPQGRPAIPQPSRITPGRGRPQQVQAQPVTQPTASGTSPVIPYDDSPNALNFQEASVDLVIMEYALRTGRTVIKAPGIPAVNITLRTTPDSPLDNEQYLMAIEQILNLNGIALERVGDSFLKVVASAEYRKHAPETQFVDPETGELPPVEAKGQFVSRMIELKYIDIAEAQTIITGFVRTGSQIQAIERTNSILITDSADTVNRIIEVLKYVDKPVIEREEPNFIQIRYAKAADIKARIEEIVSSAQDDKSKSGGSAAQERLSGAPGTERRTLPPGVTLPRRTREEPESKGAETFEALIADAQRGVIRGKVSIISDERTNLLIIITRPENMLFFNKVIEQLDVPTAPEVLVEVHRLEHAVAEDVAKIINDLIGNQKTSDSDAKPSARSKDTASTDATPSINTDRNVVPEGAKTRIGQLDAENIKILADERTNALIMMANYGDMLIIRDIINHMDIMLSQVIIETVIISLTFQDTFDTGVNWVQRAMLTGSSEDGTGPAMAFASAGGGKLTPENPLDKTTASSLSGYGAGATFIATLFDFNMDVILKAVKTDTRATVLNSPVVTTLDNKEAIIESTQRVYYSDGITTYGGSDNTTDNIKNEDIGVKLKVTPRINKSGYVALTIEQEWQNKSGDQELSNRKLPIIFTRKMGSDVAVQSGQTVVLGGLAIQGKNRTESKVPILGDIPLLGWFFRSTSIENNRNELVIFLTPTVIDTPQQIEDDARNRKAVLDTDGVWESGWSNSRLADPISEKEEKKLIERGRQTIVPPRYPLTRHLTTLNEENDIEPEVEPTTRPGSKIPYSHFSDTPKYEETEAVNEVEQADKPEQAIEIKPSMQIERVEESAPAPSDSTEANPQTWAPPLPADIAPAESAEAPPAEATDAIDDAIKAILE